MAEYTRTTTYLLADNTPIRIVRVNGSIVSVFVGTEKASQVSDIAA